MHYSVQGIMKIVPKIEYIIYLLNIYQYATSYTIYEQR